MASRNPSMPRIGASTQRTPRASSSICRVRSIAASTGIGPQQMHDPSEIRLSVA